MFRGRDASHSEDIMTGEAIYAVDLRYLFGKRLVGLLRKKDETRAGVDEGIYVTLGQDKIAAVFGLR